MPAKTARKPGGRHAADLDRRLVKALSHPLRMQLPQPAAARGRRAGLGGPDVAARRRAGARVRDPAEGAARLVERGAEGFPAEVALAGFEPARSGDRGAVKPSRRERE